MENFRFPEPLTYHRRGHWFEPGTAHHSISSRTGFAVKRRPGSTARTRWEEEVETSQANNPQVAGSNIAPSTKDKKSKLKGLPLTLPLRSLIIL